MRNRFRKLPLMAVVTVLVVASSYALPVEGARVVVHPEDVGAVLVNPGMGWALHYYDESLVRCGSRLQSLENTYEAFTTSLITNEEVIAADQEAGKSRQLFLSVEQAAWTSEAVGSSSRYLAVFNIGDQSAQDVRVSGAEIGMPDTRAVPDLWAGKSRGMIRKGNAFHVPRHGVGSFKITPGY